MKVQQIAAFCDGAVGGSPAGVVICDALPHAAVMQAVAAEAGEGVFRLQLNKAKITVEGCRAGAMMTAALQSPPTRSKPAPPNS